MSSSAPASPARLAPLCAYWFVHFAGMGLLFPYNGLYLRENAGLSAGQVGVVLAVPPLVALAAQPAWGHLADRTGARSRLLVVLGLGSALALFVFSRLSGFPALCLGMAAVALFQTSIVPSVTAVTFGTLGASGQRHFGLVRACGTLGFACLVLGLPGLLHAWQRHRGLGAASDGVSAPGLEALYVAAAALNLLAALTAVALPRGGAVGLRAARGEWRLLLGNGAYRRLLLVYFGGFLFLHGPTALFPVFLRSHGGGVGAVSRSWLFMLALEIPVVVGAGYVLRRVDARLLLAAGLAAGGLRWAGCALAGDLPTVEVLQLLHGVVVGGLLVGGPLYVDAVVPARLRSTGQSALAMVGAGLGGIASTGLTGLAMDRLGERLPYLPAGLGALGLAVIAVAFLPAPPASRPAVTSG